MDKRKQTIKLFIETISIFITSNLKLYSIFFLEIKTKQKPDNVCSISFLYVYLAIFIVLDFLAYHKFI